MAQSFRQLVSALYAYIITIARALQDIYNIFPAFTVIQSQDRHPCTSERSCTCIDFVPGWSRSHACDKCNAQARDTHTHTHTLELMSGLLQVSALRIPQK